MPKAVAYFNTHDYYFNIIVITVIVVIMRLTECVIIWHIM